jgi:hypothetical protein
MEGLRAMPTSGARERCSARWGGLAATPRRIAVDLSPQTVERVVTRVAALLREREPQGGAELISAGELARRLRVERPWVYRHRELLGGLRIGTGPKAPWRFDYERAVEALRRHQVERRSGGGR